MGALQYQAGGVNVVTNQCIPYVAQLEARASMTGFVYKCIDGKSPVSSGFTESNAGCTV